MPFEGFMATYVEMENRNVYKKSSKNRFLKSYNVTHTILISGAGVCRSSEFLLRSHLLIIYFHEEFIVFHLSYQPDNTKHIVPFRLHLLKDMCSKTCLESLSLNCLGLLMAVT